MHLKARQKCTENFFIQPLIFFLPLSSKRDNGDLNSYQVSVPHWPCPTVTYTWADRWSMQVNFLPMETRVSGKRNTDWHTLGF